ncbi:MAG: DJ-1/PfpI family protein [Planctomycetes bacterium]|nr:DJ-1/PfpI family protein [Planctomycetota bacterium]
MIAVDARETTAVILLFEGVQIIDYTGPYEVFGQAGLRVVTVAASTEPLTTAMGMHVTPNFDLAHAPEADILVIPGGGVESATENQAVISWLREKAKQTPNVLSVCNGAFILAKAGLLDGLKATTFHGLIDELKTAAPHTTIVRDQRFVDNGKIVTAAGLSSGIDGALHVVAKMRGEGFAEATALGLEYDWRPDSNFARAALADRFIPRRALSRAVAAQVRSTKGSRDRWDLAVAVESAGFAADVLARVDRELEAQGKWSRVQVGTESSNGSYTRWIFVDEEGKPWSASSKIENAGEPTQWTVTIHVERRT